MYTSTLAVLVTSDHFAEAPFILFDDPDNDNERKIQFGYFLVQVLLGL